MDEKLLSDIYDYLNMIEEDDKYIEIRSKIHDCKILLSQIKNYTPLNVENNSCENVDLYEFEEFEKYAVLKKYIGFDDEKIIMPTFYNRKCITRIADRAFENCVGLQEIVLGDEVTHIGDSAFKGCGNLISVESKKVKYIGKWAFAECGIDADTNFCFSDENNTIIEIGDYAFSESAIAECDFRNLEHIGNFAFYCAGSSNSIGELGYPTFYEFSIYLPDTLTYIGDSAFAGCSIDEDFTIPINVKHIGEKAFENCYQTIKVFSKSCFIGEGAFSDESTIYCYLGSTAQKYCRENRIEHKQIK